MSTSRKPEDYLESFKKECIKILDPVAGMPAFAKFLTAWKKVNDFKD